MAAPAIDTLPETLRSVHTRPLFVLELEVLPYQIVGGPENAFRRVGVVPGGTFRGERLSGTVLPGGNDWQTVFADGSNTLDVKLVLQADDGAMIGLTYTGIRRGPPEVLARVGKGEDVDPSSYYFRTQATFSTASRHTWLNGLPAVGIGYRTPAGVVYSLFEIL